MPKYPRTIGPRPFEIRMPMRSSELNGILDRAYIHVLYLMWRMKPKTVIFCVNMAPVYKVNIACILSSTAVEVRTIPL